MDTYNPNHYTLNKEAKDALDQAEQAGWDTACVVKLGGALYPIISLSQNSGPDLSVGIETIPGLVNQSIRYRLAEDGPTNYIKICYNQPVISPEQAVALIQVLNGQEKAENA